MRNVLGVLRRSEPAAPSGTANAEQMGVTARYTCSLSLKSTALFLCGFNLLPFMSGGWGDGACVCVRVCVCGHHPHKNIIHERRNEVVQQRADCSLNIMGRVSSPFPDFKK